MLDFDDTMLTTTCSGSVLNTGIPLGSLVKLILGIPLVDSCADSSNIVTARLTSGYFSNLLLGPEDRRKPGSFKCSHGGPLDATSPLDILTLTREGINKDSKFCDISPHSMYHDLAASAAIEGTKQFVNDIRKEITVAQLRALLGDGTSLAFAIDTTGSMGDIIGQVRSDAVTIVNDRLGTDEEPAQYVLSPFNDPFTGPVTVTSDPTAFKAAISDLTASGGGDCPELAMQGVYAGVAAADLGGDLFLYTDASAKDAALANTVTGLANAKNIKINPVLFGSCSPIDPAFLQIATLTGGQVFFLPRNQAGQITQLADLTAKNNAVQILSILDNYSVSKTYTLPVDSAMTSLTVAVSSTDQVTTPTVTLRRPDGTVVAPGDPGVTSLAISQAVVRSIANPAVGAWELTIQNSPLPTYVNVTGESPLRFDSFKFVDVGGQPPHQGLFPIQGSPVAGQSLYTAASLTRGFATAAFDWRLKNYGTLQNLALDQDGTDDRLFFGQVTVPAQPFLAYVTGTDTAGAAYQRVVPVSVTPQTVAITAPARQDLRPGNATLLMFQVTNFGDAGSFTFTATDDQSYISGVSPRSFSLSTGQSINVGVQLTPGATVPIGGSDTLTATVQSSTNTTLRNTAALTLYVTGAAPSGGVPNFVAGVIKQTKVASGTYNVDVRFTNTGPGAAQNFTVSSLNFRTLSGSGAVTYNTMLAPALPLTMPNVDVGSFVTITLTLDVPLTARRFTISETGSVLDTNGATYAFSQAQAVIPQ
jgi:von Willebrand factor A domain-containing protein 7